MNNNLYFKNFLKYKKKLAINKGGVLQTFLVSQSINYDTIYEKCFNEYKQHVYVELNNLDKYKHV